MASNDYTQELGMSTKQPKIPLPVVLILIAGIIAAGWYGFSTYKAPAHAQPEVTGKTTSVTATPHHSQ
ncbi:MAG: hypothetical protein NTV51_30650 [Verrucomicrobia bacterium]|nr:hypothetical protein [Verrucomicrobiota bacterium]